MGDSDLLKTVNFRNVEWIGTEARPDLTSMLIQTLNSRPHVDDTRFEMDGQLCEVNHRLVDDDLILMHFTTFVEGGLRATYPRLEGVSEADAGTASAPEGSEFTEREIAVGFRSSALGFVVAGHARHTTVERALRGLLALDNGHEVANKIVLSARANEDEIQRLLEEGVEYVDLGLSMPFVEAERMVGDQPATISGSVLNAIASSLSARFNADYTEDDIREMADTNSRLIFKADRRGRLAHTELLTEIATQIAETEEEFVIKTKAGNQFTRESLSIKSTYRQSGPRSVLHYLEAWTAVRALLDSVR